MPVSEKEEDIPVRKEKQKTTRGIHHAIGMRSRGQSYLLYTRTRPSMPAHTDGRTTCGRAASREKSGCVAVGQCVPPQSRRADCALQEHNPEEIARDWCIGIALLEYSPPAPRLTGRPFGVNTRQL